MNTAYLGLGSNVGNREKNLIDAVGRIKKHCTLIDYSSIYLTAPVGVQNQEDFLNMAVKVDSRELTPASFLTLMKSIELQMGREVTYRWGPRLIDIDILYMSGVSVNLPDLIIPHREILKRLFVLVPLSEITNSLILSDGEIKIKDQISILLKDTVSNSENDVRLFKGKGEIDIDA